VVVTKAKASFFYCFSFKLFLLFSLSAHAVVLPEQRADTLYHSYDGGGVTIDGPSFLFRKTIANDKVSIYGNYYVDMVTSASVDVIATASEYNEERTEYSIGADYLTDKTILSLSYTNSTESDYIADTVGFSVSQDFFGDLSTITLGFVLGDDTVKQTGAPNFEKQKDTKRFSFGFSQVITKNLLASISYEGVIDEGFLRNPYRSARIADTNSANGLGFSYLSQDIDGDGFGDGENYPSTRNSDAFAIRAIYALNPKSSLRFEVRQYDDSWGIKSNNIELRYTREFRNKWLVEARVRQYKQDQASFYYDVIPSTIRVEDEDTFFARDKELSNYSSQQFGIGLTYKFSSLRSELLDNSELSFFWDRLTFDYDNFSDATTGALLADETLYSLDADVFRIFFSSRF